MNIESKFEELENIINDKWVRDKVTDLKNISIDLIDCLIFELKANVKQFGLKKTKLLTMCYVIEKATGKTIDEVLKNEQK